MEQLVVGDVFIQQWDNGYYDIGTVRKVCSHGYDAAMVCMRADGSIWDMRLSGYVLFGGVVPLYLHSALPKEVPNAIAPPSSDAVAG